MESGSKGPLQGSRREMAGDGCLTDTAVCAPASPSHQPLPTVPPGPGIQDAACGPAPAPHS